MKKLEEFDTYIVVNKDISKEEIEKLKQHNLPIIFTDDPESYYDDVGCFHTCATGYNPQGIFCGECTRVSGKECPGRWREYECKFNC